MVKEWHGHYCQCGALVKIQSTNAVRNRSRFRRRFGASSSLVGQSSSCACACARVPTCNQPVTCTVLFAGLPMIASSTLPTLVLLSPTAGHVHSLTFTPPARLATPSPALNIPSVLWARGERGVVSAYDSGATVLHRALAPASGSVRR